MNCLIPPNAFPLCHKEAESAFHILFICPFTLEVCHSLLLDVDVHWVFPGSLKAMAEQWNTRDVDREGKVVWRLMLPPIWWSIWLERNNRVFENSLEPSFMVYKRAEKCLFWAVCCKEIGCSIVDVRAGWVNFVKGRL